LTKKEIKAKEHLEQMEEITKKIGYSDLRTEKKETHSFENEYNFQKEREE